MSCSRLSWPCSLTRHCPRPGPAPAQPAHLAAGEDGAGPLVGLVQLVPAVWLLLEPRLPFGRVVIPEAGRLCLGDKFDIVHEDEGLEDGPEREERASARPGGAFTQQPFPEPAHRAGG